MVQGLSGGEATTAACDDRLPQRSRPQRKFRLKRAKGQRSRALCV
ncbi:hypothetical protein PGR6_01700 [Pseudomonas sp. GR 6-02]|nr:hypothetical protein PGR6_01700 [Pseudomonas sp. GR 6-02]